MNTFLVFMPEGGKAVQSVFPRNYAIMQDVLWAVASDLTTCADVSERLGMNPVERNRGVVTRIDEFYGYFDRALWEKLNAWKLAE